jgi:hypothetical protein
LLPDRRVFALLVISVLADVRLVCGFYAVTADHIIGRWFGEFANWLLARECLAITGENLGIWIVGTIAGNFWCKKFRDGATGVNSGLLLDLLSLRPLCVLFHWTNIIWLLGSVLLIGLRGGKVTVQYAPPF